MASEKKYIDPKLGWVTVRKSRQARRISIRVTPVKGVVVTVPHWVPYRVGEAFLYSRADWAEMALHRMKERVRKAMEQDIFDPETEQDELVRETEQSELERGTKQDDLERGTEQDDLERKIEQWREMAKETLPPRLAELAGEYGFHYGRVTIKHNRSNWGSCSAKGNINLNLNLVRLPKELQDYVMLHELCHLRYMDHGTGFHRLLEDLCRREGIDKDSMRKQLKSYILL